MRVPALFLALALAPGGCGDGCPLTREREVQELASVADAPEHDRSFTGLRFTAEVKPELAGYKSWSTRAPKSSTVNYRTAAMIPAVPAGWTKADPVPLWIRVDASAKTEGDPAMRAKIDALVAEAAAGPIEVSIAQHLEAEVDMDGTNAFQIGARRAMEAHGLTSPPGVPLCTWPMSKGRLRIKDDAD